MFVINRFIIAISLFIKPFILLLTLYLQNKCAQCLLVHSLQLHQLQMHLLRQSSQHLPLFQLKQIWLKAICLLKSCVKAKDVGVGEDKDEDNDV